jgi:hypothetical protein
MKLVAEKQSLIQTSYIKSVMKTIMGVGRVLGAFYNTNEHKKAVWSYRCIQITAFF